MARIDKQALRKQILELNIDNELKSQLLTLVAEQKRYGLVWENSIEDVEESLRENVPVLTEVKERAIINDNETQKNPNHILIEGDNLEALTALAYTHEGKIDVIYIDPPYNTGNKDFVYNDSYVDSEDSYRHSKWLSFMSRRLKIAKRLLSDRGVIFISIDDNEQSQLKLLCDEAFGEYSFIAKFDWRKKTGANDAKDIAVVTESILLYAKNHQLTIEEDLWQRDEGSINIDRYKYEDEFVETRGKFYYDTLDRGGLQYSDSMNFGIEAPDGGVIFPNGRDVFINDGWTWKWGKEKVKWGIENKFLVFIKSKKSAGSKYTIKYKVYQFVDNEGNIRKKSGRAYMNLITEPINQIGNSEMKEIFGNETPFSNPKPTGLIRYLFQTIKNNKAVVFDFFAGSGTTLHATMQLNAEDDGHRQCILVTNNENNICEEVTYERNKRVINGYTTPKGGAVDGLTNNNLRYFKCEKKPRDLSHQSKKQLVLAMTDLLRIKEDIYSEQDYFGVLPLIGKATLLRFFEDGDNRMLIIYDTRVLPFVIKEIEKMDGLIKVYIFADGAYPYSEDFRSVADKVELIPLPHAFNSALKHVLPDAIEEMLPDVDLTQEEQDEMMEEAIAAENND